MVQKDFEKIIIEGKEFDLFVQNTCNKEHLQAAIEGIQHYYRYVKDINGFFNFVYKNKRIHLRLSSIKRVISLEIAEEIKEEK